jgi:hypothetical protein
MSRKVKDSDPEAELREAFAVFDQDKSGTISADELRRVLRSIGDDVSDADVDEMLRMADVNGDGSIDCKLSPFLVFFVYIIERADAGRNSVSGIVGCFWIYWADWMLYR